MIAALGSRSVLAPDEPPSDAVMVAMAASTAIGAHWRPGPSGPASTSAMAAVLFAAAVVAAAIRRPVVVGLLLAAVASMLADRAWEGLEPPARGRFEGTVALLSDPTETAFGLRADVRVGSRRVEMRASEGAAGVLDGALAGETLRVSGTLGPPPDDAPWLVPRHVSGRLDASRVEIAGRGAAHHRAANRLRRLLESGTESMPRTARSLFGGFVLGDDRDQPPEVADDFLGAGLTHVLVVSGSNVAFVLVLVAPLSNRLGLVNRWLVTLAVIAGFALLTRFEPSVLRASAMAAVAVTGGLLGRPQTGLRILSLAVTGLLLIDPLLVHSTAFQLSVGASLGILVVGPWLRRRLPGPAALRDVLGVTIAAQLGVVPILIPRFGGMPVVALPANVLAVPVAGAVTTWGLPAGIVAGLLGGRWAEVIHVPTELMIGWVAGVARVSSSLPLGEIGMRELVVAVVAGGAALVDGRHRRGVITWTLAAVAVAALLAPAAALRSPPHVVDLGEGATLHRRGGAVVLEIGARPRTEDVMEGLRRNGVRRIDLILWHGRPDRRLIRAIGHRAPVAASLGPDDPPTILLIGDLRIEGGGGDAAAIETTAHR